MICSLLNKFYFSFRVRKQSQPANSYLSFNISLDTTLQFTI